MSNELKVNIVRAIANHYISRDEMDENLIYEQAGAIQEFLDMQMKLYEQLRTTTNTPHKLKINPENGEVIFGEGALIHCAGQCDYDKLSGIKEKGIMAGDSLLQDNEYMEMIRAMFPNCYILNREGRIFFSPDLTPEQNKENQLECLKVIPEQEGWRKDRVKKTIEYLLSSAIEATEEITRTGIINEQVSNIAQLTKGKDEKSKGTEIG